MSSYRKLTRVKILSHLTLTIPAPGHLLDSHAQIFHSYLLTFSVYFIYYFTGPVPIL